MDGRERRCGLCGHLNPPAAEFCSECGILLASVPAAGLTKARQTQFALPDYLLAAREREREERRRRLATESGEGVGLLWTGAIAAVLALWFGGGAGVGVPIFVVGLLVAFIGLWRLRGDAKNMARAGTATVVVSSVVLGAALAQTLGFAGSGIAQPRLVVTTVTPTPDPAESPTMSAADLGSVPMFRGGAARTGENPGPAPSQRPVVQWKTYVGGETYASPVVANGLVYVATKAGSLVALALADGEEQWRMQVGEYVARTTPAFDDGTLFVAAGYTLLAIDAATGQQRWSVPLRFAGSCSPVAAEGRVYVATQEGHVSAFETERGDEVWHYRNDNLLFASPALDAGVIVIGDEAGMVTAISASTGREMWQKPAGGDIFATPAIAAGVVFVATNEPSLLAFDLKSGRELWQRGVGGQSSPAIDNGTIFLGGDDQALRAIDAKTGDVRWSSPMGYVIRASATVSGDDVFIGSGPTLNAVDRRDGKIVWTHVTGGDISADMAVIGDHVIATSHDGYVYALGPPEKIASSGDSTPNDERGVSLGTGR